MLKLSQFMYGLLWLVLLYTIPVGILCVIYLPLALRTGLICICFSGILAIVSLYLSTRVILHMVSEGLIKFDENNQAYMTDVEGKKISMSFTHADLFDDDSAEL